MSHDLIVIGGGPAGSAAAAIAARAGLDVLLIEADKHPRVHVGESLLPGIIPVLEEMGALEAVESAGFERKSGTSHWQWGLTPEWDLWFSDTESYDHAWLVERARFDEILFRAAERAGAKAIEHALVRELVWDGERMAGVRFERRGEAERETAKARFVIDASGQAALFARQLGLRSIIEGLRHQCEWAHYESAGRLPAPRQNMALFVAEPGHWLWLFPLSDMRASVGIVRLEDAVARSDAERALAFDRDLAASQAFMRVLGGGARRRTPVRSQRDWSYRMSRVVGPGWLLAGDASGFIDPVLSTGVFLAMHAGHNAAHSVIEIVKNDVDESEALARYQRHHSELFGDLLRMVRFYYQQNLHVEDYFWESKRILMRPDVELKPQKAFLILTSGLVRNLAFEERAHATRDRREKEVASHSAEDLAAEPSGAGHDPDQLGFVCFQLRAPHGEGHAKLWFLIEPTEPAAPSLFRTPSWDLNCLAPRFGNDPIREPTLAVALRAIEAKIRALDSLAGEPLAQFWRRSRAEIVAAVREQAPAVELERVFGE